jgi:hypothetical protein
METLTLWPRIFTGATYTPSTSYSKGFETLKKVKFFVRTADGRPDKGDLSVLRYNFSWRSGSW